MRELPKGFEAKLRFIYKYDTSMELGVIESFTNDVGIQNEEDFVGTIVKLISEREDPKEFEYWIKELDECHSVLKRKYDVFYPFYLVAMQQIDELRDMANNSQLSEDEKASAEYYLDFKKKDFIIRCIKNDCVSLIKPVYLYGFEKDILSGYNKVPGKGKVYETDPKYIYDCIEERVSQRLSSVKSTLYSQSDKNIAKTESCQDTPKSEQGNNSFKILLIVLSLIFSIIIFIVILGLIA